MSDDDIIRTVQDVQYGQLEDEEAEVMKFHLEEIVFEADCPEEKYTMFTVDKTDDIIVERTNLPSQRVEYFLYPEHVAVYTVERQMKERTRNSGFDIITHINKVGIEPQW